VLDGLGVLLLVRPRCFLRLRHPGPMVRGCFVSYDDSGIGLLW